MYLSQCLATAYVARAWIFIVCGILSACQSYGVRSPGLIDGGKDANVPELAMMLHVRGERDEKPRLLSKTEMNLVSLQQNRVIELTAIARDEHTGLSMVMLEANFMFECRAQQSPNADYVTMVLSARNQQGANELATVTLDQPPELMNTELEINFTDAQEECRKEGMYYMHKRVTGVVRGIVRNTDGIAVTQPYQVSFSRDN